MSKGRALRVDYRAALSCVGSANERQRLKTYRVLADVYQLLEEYAPVFEARWKQRRNRPATIKQFERVTGGLPGARPLD